MALVLVGALPALLAGPACGDDEEALSRDEFVTQANTICEAGNERLDAAGEEIFGDLGEGDQPSAEQIKRFFEDELAPDVEKQINDIRDLTPPEDIADEVEEALDDAETALDELKQQVEDDPESVFSSEGDPFEDVNTKLNALGLNECADDGESDDDQVEDDGSGSG